MPTEIDRRLSLILEEETTHVSDNPYQAAMNVANELETTRRKVADLERQLIYAVDRLCGGLAIGVRRYQPGLNVGINDGSCRVGYRSKSLAFKPDLVNKTWVIDSPDRTFAKRFNRIHGSQTVLDSDLTQIAQSIAKFFHDHYRSLGESISGKGLILIEGKKAGLAELAEFILKNDKLLRGINEYQA